MKQLTHLEEIFIKNAKTEIKDFCLDEFKSKDFILYKVILKSIISGHQDGYEEAMEDVKEILRLSK